MGDDIAWLKPDDKGMLRAINPEAGFFGVAPGTSWETNPNAMESMRENSLFTNVALTEDGDVWWEGLTDDPPKKLTDWKGRSGPLRARNLLLTQTPDLPAQLPNVQPSTRIGKIQMAYQFQPLFSEARRMSDIPLVYQSFNWNHGVYLRATLASETTAAAEGALENLRRDPMAMIPFADTTWETISDIG